MLPKLQTGDSQGAAFAVFTSNHPGGDPKDEAPLGSVSWHELGTSDWASAFEFYSALFGWNKCEEMDMGDGAIYLLYGVGEQMVGGMFTKTPEMPGPHAWLYYISVPSTVAAIEKAKSLGATLLNGPMEVPGEEWVAQLMDPQGAVFAVHSKDR